MFDQTDPKEKMLGVTRALKLKPKEGLKAKNSLGLIDPRLFSGDNHLIASMEPNGLWRMYYETGVTPPPIRGQYTSFNKLLEAARMYFGKRNVEVFPPEYTE